MEHTRRGIERLLLLPLLLLAQPALAQEHAPPAPVRMARAPERPALLPPGRRAAQATVLECEGDRGMFAVLVHPRKMTTFYFPSTVLDAVNPAPRHLVMELSATRVTVQPRSARQGFLGNLRVSSRACEAHIDLWLAEHVEDVPVTVDIRQRDIMAEELARMRAEHDQHLRAIEEQKRALNEERHLVERERADVADAMLRKLLLDESPLVPVIGKTGHESERLDMHIARGTWHGNDFLLLLEVENRQVQPHRLAQVQVVDAVGGLLDAQVLGTVSSTGARGEQITELQPGERVKYLIKIVSAAEKRIAPLSVRLTDTSGMQFLARADDWRFVYPVNYEQERKRELAREREERDKDRVILHIDAALGGIWLLDDLGMDRKALTSLKGLGLRVTYGFNRMFGVEARALGASTGQARFGDTVWNGTQGDLLRSASLGRVQAGLVGRMGYDTIPVIRAGLGVQGMSTRARFEVDGSTMPGPESPFDVDGIWYFGGGLDFRLGKHFMAGFTASFEWTMGNASRSLQAGVHLGYGWKP